MNFLNNLVRSPITKKLIESLHSQIIKPERLGDSSYEKSCNNRNGCNYALG
jgi:hypothetical protein